MTLDMPARPEVPPAADARPLPELEPLDTMVFCVGTQKAGTSWLANRFNASPEVYMRVKEPHYWTRNWGPGADGRCGLPGPGKSRIRGYSYRVRRKLFGDASLPAHEQFTGHPYDHSRYAAHLVRGLSGQRIVADFTPNYAGCSAATFAQMARVHRDTRFILVMRDPFDRLWSGIRHRVRFALPRIEDHGFLLQMLRDCMSDPRNEDRSLSAYSEIIPRLEAGVGRERVHYAFFETLFTQESLDAISAFVGLKAPLKMVKDAVNEGGRVKVKPDPALVAEIVKGFAPDYAFVRSRFADAVPESWRA